MLNKNGLSVILVVLLMAFAFGPNAFAVDGPTGKAPAPAAKEPSAAKEPTALAKSIQQSVKQLGYPDSVGPDLVKISSGWKCDNLKQRITKAKQNFQRNIFNEDQVAEVENDIVEALCETIRTEIEPAESGSDYFYLPKIVKDKKATSLGYTQLFYILGSAVGLKVKPVYVLQHNSAKVPGQINTNSASLVEYANGNSVLLETLGSITLFSKPFVFSEEFKEDGEFWMLKNKFNRFKIIHLRIQTLDRKGLVADIYDSLGAAYGTAEKHKEALAYFNKALELNPNFVRAYLNRGTIYRTTKETKKSVEDLTKAVEIDPMNDDGFYKRGLSYIELEKYEDAIADFDKAVDLDPLKAHAFFSRGAAKASLGRFPEAKLDLLRSLDLNPNLEDKVRELIQKIQEQKDEQILEQ